MVHNTWRIHRRFAASLVLHFACLAGCGIGDDLLEDSDPTAIPTTVTYRQHIEPRIHYYCGGCHNPNGILGNAGGWNFATYPLVRAAYGSIQRVAFEERRMPPGGARKMSPRDQAIFRRWRQNGFAEK